MDATTVEWDGKADLVGQAYAMGYRNSDVTHQSSWTLQADAVTIHEETYRGTLVGGLVVVFEDGSPSHATYHYDKVWAYTVGTDDLQYLLVAGTDDGNGPNPFHVELETRNANAVWSSGISFVGRPHYETVEPFDSFHGQVEYTAQIENMEIALQETRPIHANGNFTLIVFGFDYQVESGNAETRLHRTGEFHSNETVVTPFTPDGVMADFTVRVATLEITNGSMTLLTDGWPGTLHMESFSSEMEHGTLALKSSEGTLRANGLEATHRGDLTLDGISVTATATTGRGTGQISLEVWAEAVVVRENGAAPAWQPVTQAPEATVEKTWLRLALIALALVVSAGTLKLAFAYSRIKRRLAGYALRKCEAAMLKGGAGGFWSRLALFLMPESNEVVLAHATWMVDQGRAEEAVTLLNGHLEKVTGGDVAMLMMTLSIALEQVGELEEARAIYREAIAADPALRTGALGQWASQRLGIQVVPNENRFDYV